MMFEQKSITDADKKSTMKHKRDIYTFKQTKESKPANGTKLNQ